MKVPLVDVVRLWAKQYRVHGQVVALGTAAAQTVSVEISASRVFAPESANVSAAGRRLLTSYAARIEALAETVLVAVAHDDAPFAPDIHSDRAEAAADILRRRPRMKSVMHRLVPHIPGGDTTVLLVVGAGAREVIGHVAFLGELLRHRYAGQKRERPTAKQGAIPEGSQDQSSAARGPSPGDAESLPRPLVPIAPTVSENASSAPLADPAKVGPLADVAGAPFDRSFHISYVAKAAPDGDLSHPAYLLDDTAEHPLGQYEVDSLEIPDSIDFALNYYRQPAHTYFGQHYIEIVPISIGPSGEALEHAELFFFANSESVRLSSPTATLGGKSWSYKIGNHFIYRWRAETDNIGILGFEILAPLVEEAEQEENEFFSLPMRLYYKQKESDDILVKEMDLIIPTQHIRRFRIV